MKTDIKKREDSTVEISVSVPSTTLMAEWPQALASIKEVAEIDGFRKGHVPESMILSRFGDMAILEEAAQRTIQKVYPSIVMDNKLEVLGMPEVTISKLAKDNDFEFKVVVAVMPELKLPSYKKIAAKEMKEKTVVTVTPEEVAQVIEETRKARSTKKVGEDGTETNELPELTDEFVKTLGDFKDVATFRAKVEENLLQEKQAREKDKKRVAIVEAIEKETTGVIPAVLIDSEVDRMAAQLRADIASFGGTLEGYLTHIKKTEEDLRKEWRGEAERRAKIQIILNQVANEEKIKASQEDIDHEVSHLLEHYKDLEKSKAEGYVQQMLQNEKVMQFFEAQ